MVNVGQITREPDNNVVFKLDNKEFNQLSNNSNSNPNVKTNHDKLSNNNDNNDGYLDSIKKGKD
jgi:hypothetical protein